MVGGGGDRDAAGDGDDDGGDVAIVVADDGDDYVGVSCAVVASAVVAVDLLDLNCFYFQVADPPLLYARVSHALYPIPHYLCYKL